MDEHSHVLALLRVWARGPADHLRRVPSGKKPEIASKTTEQALRNRALAICRRLQGMAASQRPRSSTGLSPACSPRSRHG